MSSSAAINKATSILSAATFFSRLLGFARDMMLAALFSVELKDAFLVAFRIPNALRRFVAEGAFSISVVPVYSKQPNERSQQELVNVLYKTLTVFLLGLTCVLLALAPWFIDLYAPGLRQSGGESFSQAVLWLRIMFPYLACLSLVALSMGILNTHGTFFAPAFAPVFLNLFFMVGMALQTWLHPDSMTLTAVAVMLSGFAQLAYQWPSLKKVARLPQWTRQWWSPEVGRIARLWFPAMWSVSLIQITTLLSTRFASRLTPGTITGMYLAERIIELPLGVFAIAIGQASLPVLSRLLKQDPPSYDGTIRHAMTLSALLSFPAAVGIAVLAEPIARTFFFRGQFDLNTLGITVDCILIYALSIPFGAQLRTFAAAYHSHERMTSPAWISTIALGVYALIATATYPTWHHWGLTWASTVSVFLNALGLLVYFLLRVRRFDLKPLVLPISKIFLAATGMGVLIWVMKDAAPSTGWTTEWARWFWLGILCTTGAMTYLGLLLLLRMEEGRWLLEKLKSAGQKLGKKNR